MAALTSDGQSQDKVMPIAIIGMACRFPGDGENIESLFEMLKRGENAWSEFPADRVNIDGFYHPSGNRQGSIGFRGAHFLKGDIKGFDAPFFNISSTEAQAIDPQQRILLEVTYQALENAGYSKESLNLSETSVNVGTFVKDYEQIVLRDPDWAPQYAATGTGNAILSNRISYQFNLRGPSQTVDTGCSASLVGVHNGCQDLRTGRADLAIAAGVGMILTPATMMPMTALNFLGKDGKCYTFTNKAEGYGRGEGVGVVILKRLDDAIRDNDTIRAVIRGSRVNQDGRTPGITMPSADAQLSNIRAVYKDAGLDVNETAYVECHGTGTPAGDPKEAFAISQAFCGDRNADQPIYIASIKPNVGHLEGAAGIAGLIKAVMSIEQGQITKNLYFDTAIANPDIKFDEWKVKVPTALTPWPTPGLRRASVNCFGFGGTNAHVILDDALSYMGQRGLPGNGRADQVSPKQRTWVDTHLFRWSSHEKDGIYRIAQGQRPYIADNASDANLLPNYSYTLSRRSALEYKTFIVAQSPAELAAKLAQHQDLPLGRFIADDGKPPRFAMVFCGQGAQWHSMGRELMQYEPYCNSIVGASKYLSKIVGSDFDLLHELCYTHPALSRIHEPKFSQPATTAVQVALVDLLKTANIVPQAVVGHSSGEIAAAYAAGYITREDAWLIAYRRGQHATSLAHLHSGLKGRMMAVGLSPVEAQRYIAKVKPNTVVVACENSPVSVTLSGDEEQILELAAILASDGVFHRMLAVKTAYHSHHMRHVEAAYRESMKDITPKSRNDGMIMVSSVTGEMLDGSLLDASYWAKNLVSPVLFNTALAAMYKKIRPKFVVEVSPAIVLNRPIQEIITSLYPNKNKAIACIPMLKRGTHASVTALEALGEVWARGVSVDFLWATKSKEGRLPRLLVDLPPYPFDHSKSYWFESHLGTNLRFRKHGREDLIGAPLAESTPQNPIWRGFFRIEENPWLADHQVQKATIYPASGLIAMALEAARQCVDPTLAVDIFQISNFNIAKPVIIPAGQHGLEHMINAKIIRTPSPDSTQGSAVYSFSILTRTEHGQWQENADGQLSIIYHARHSTQSDHRSPLGEDYASIYRKVQAECTQVVNPRQLYERLDGIGMNYGPIFRNIVALSKCSQACTSVVRIPDTKSKMPSQFEFDHLIHPATLDTMFQTVFAIGDSSMVPSYIRQISFSPDMLRGAGAEFHGYATAQLKGLREAQADIIMSDATFSKPMVVLKGMGFVKISSDVSGFLPSNRHLCSEIIWQELCPVPTYLEGTMTLNEGSPVMLLLPDEPFSHDISPLVKLLQLNNVECVCLSEISAKHMKMPCISIIEAEHPVVFDMCPTTFAKIKQLLLTTPGLLWVTKGGQMSAYNPTTAPIVGLTRTIRSEDSSKRIANLDLDPVSAHDGSEIFASAIQSVFNWSCAPADCSEIAEVEYCLQAGRLYVARLTPLDALNDVIEKGQDEAVQFEDMKFNEIEHCVKLKVGHGADMSNNYFVLDQIPPLGSTEVRVLVDSTNLFPIDLDTVMGKSSENVLGFDVIGRVTDIGSDVKDLCNGDVVFGLARNTLRMSTIVDQSMLQLLKDRNILWGVSPTALVTAYYGLNNLGCVSAGDKVFIDRAAGPYGDAALAVAHTLGATIYAGVLNAEDRDFIHINYNIPMSRIIETTHDRFPEEVMRLTEGTGIDFFFSPTSDHLELSSQCITSNGHLFTILNTNGVAPKSAAIPQHADISLHRFDLYALLEKRPKTIAKAWNEVYGMHLSTDLGHCPPTLVREERIENLSSIWQNMAAAPGRYLNTVTFTDSSIVRVGRNPVQPAELDPDSTYLLVGGLGGLGKAVANLLVQRGARHILFLSRSGIKSPEDATFVQSLMQQGVNILYGKVDICNEKDLRSALECVNMPPIKGVIQCAAVIADAVFETMTYEEWAAATRPKMIGSLNLHNLLPQDMDFFIFLSSASGVIGNRGQGNYAAGNSFQDALARHRSAMGCKNSVSIDLGPVLGAGMLENDEKTLALLKSSGFFMVELENVLFIIDCAIAGKDGTGPLELPAQVVTGVGTGGLLVQNDVADPFWAETKMFEILNCIDVADLSSTNSSLTSVSSPSSSTGSAAASGRSLALALKQADSLDDAAAAILHGCIEYLSTSLSMSAQDMDVDKSLTAYGVDSLVTSSFRNWIFKNVGVKVTDLEVIGAASIGELAQGIAEKGHWGQ